jgi:glycosyltransferase involved in cell wall biosynthesis
MTTDRDGDRRPHRRPRVLRVITRLSVSGPSTHVTLTNQLLARRGWDTLLVHGRLQPDELAFGLPVPDVATEYLPALARPIDPIADLRAGADILDVVRRYRPDIIHTHHSKAGLLGRSVAVLAGIPRVHTFHGHVFEGYFSGPVSTAIVTAERLMARASSRLIVLGPLQMEDLLGRGIGRREQFEVVPLGLDLHRFQPGDRAGARVRLGLPSEALIVVAVGRIVPIKRIAPSAGPRRRRPARPAWGVPSRSAAGEPMSPTGTPRRTSWRSRPTAREPHWRSSRPRRRDGPRLPPRLAASRTL